MNPNWFGSPESRPVLVNADPDTGARKLTKINKETHVKTPLFVSAKYYQDPDMHGSHWFGSLDPNPHLGKKLDSYPGPRRNYCRSTTQILKSFRLGLPYHFIFLNFVVFRDVPRGYGESRSLRTKVGNCVRCRCIAHSSTRVFFWKTGVFKNIYLVYRYSPKDFLNYVQIRYVTYVKMNSVTVVL